MKICHFKGWIKDSLLYSQMTLLVQFCPTVYGHSFQHPQTKQRIRQNVSPQLIFTFIRQCFRRLISQIYVALRSKQVI